MFQHSARGRAHEPSPTGPSPSCRTAPGPGRAHRGPEFPHRTVRAAPPASVRAELLPGTVPPLTPLEETATLVMSFGGKPQNVRRGPEGAVNGHATISTTPRDSRDVPAPPDLVRARGGFR